MTNIEFANTMAILTIAVGKPLTDEQAKLWLELLNDLTVDQLRRGIIDTLKTHQFGGYPPIGVIRKNALGGIQSTTLEVSDRAIIAWDAAVNAIRTQGGYRTVEFDDPVISATIRAIAPSWADLCAVESEELHNWKKKAFVETYRSFSASRQVSATAAGALPGILAEDARLNGYDDPEAIVIETNLPASTVKVLPIRESVRIEAAESVGRSMSLPVVKKDEPAKPDVVLIGFEDKRAEFNKKLLERQPT